MDVDVGIDSGIEVSPLKRKSTSEPCTPVKLAKSKKLGRKSTTKFDLLGCGCKSKITFHNYYILLFSKRIVSV